MQIWKGQCSAAGLSCVTCLRGQTHIYLSTRTVKVFWEKKKNRKHTNIQTENEVFTHFITFSQTWTGLFFNTWSIFFIFFRCHFRAKIMNTYTQKCLFAIVSQVFCFPRQKISWEKNNRATFQRPTNKVKKTFFNHTLCELIKHSQRHYGSRL